MSEEDNDPESTIPWPGFVDILSTVIIVFVFFMMMTSVIIFVLSEQAKKKAVEAVKQSQSQAGQTKSDGAVSAEISELKSEKEKLEKDIHELKQLKSVLSQSNGQTFKREGETAIITFGDMGVTLTPETSAFLKQQVPFKGPIEINTFIREGKDFNSIREIALYRALNSRNVLLQNGISKDQITIKINIQKQDATIQSGKEFGSVSVHFAK